jgi:DNA-binding NarL/FixJ family response regulator
VVARIFLVDDNPMIRSRLRFMLEKHGEWVIVGEAENGRRALEKWSEHSPEVIVMDFVMPEMNGLEASRQLTKRAKVPILMITIDPSRQLELEAQKAGVKGLCLKADLNSMMKGIEALLEGKTYFKA